MMRNRALGLVLLLLSAGGCQPKHPPAGAVASPTELEPAEPRTPVEALVHSSHHFALDLYARLANKPGNIVVSPHSIYSALAMTELGASGETAREMAAAMHFEDREQEQQSFGPLSDAITALREQEQQSFGPLSDAITALDANAHATDGGPMALHIVNRVYADEAGAIREEFVQALRTAHDSEATPLDFQHAPDDARERINSEVAELTAGKIDSLLPEGSIQSLTRLVLVNAIYLNAAWARPFSALATHEQVFHAPGADVHVPFVSGEGSYGHYADDDVEIVAVPLSGNLHEMIFFAPKSITGFEKDLTAPRLRQQLRGLRYDEGKLEMPKFSFRFNERLDEELQDMGISRAFDPKAADFSGMSDETPLFIGGVFHSAFIAVEEAGVEAGAATAVVMSTDSPAAFSMRIDRPYLFAIRHRETGALLFWGRVEDPSA